MYFRRYIGYRFQSVCFDFHVDIFLIFLFDTLDYFLWILGVDKNMPLGVNKPDFNVFGVSNGTVIVVCV